MLTVIRYIAVPFFAFGLYFGYGYGLDALSILVDLVAVKRYYQSIGFSQASFQTMIILSVIVPYTLFVTLISLGFSRISTWLYREEAIWIACLSVLPVLVARGEELIPPANLSLRNSLTYAVSVYELSSFVLLVCVGTFLASRRTSRI